jgi:deferrochelatase/peroxidase EfeB
MLPRLMLRRGMPYGSPVRDPLRAPVAIDDEDRGLMFVAYQTSIERQFEFVQRTWANQKAKPREGGQDPLIGQTVRPPRRFDLRGTSGPPATLTLPESFVLPAGGGYFFAPSVSTLAGRLAGGP